MGRTTVALLLIAALTVSCASGADSSTAPPTTESPPPPTTSVPVPTTTPPILAAAEQAQETWQEVRRPDYVFVLNRGCRECDQTLVGSFRITVRQHEVALVERMPMQEPIVVEDAPTIDTLLRDVAAHLEDHPEATAEFDPTLGIPLQAELGEEDSIVVEYLSFDVGAPSG